MVGAETGPDTIHHSTHSSAVIPVRTEVRDEVLWNDGHDPTQHGLLGRHALPATLDLEPANESPD